VGQITCLTSDTNRLHIERSDVAATEIPKGILSRPREKLIIATRTGTGRGQYHPDKKEHIANLEQIEYALSNFKRPFSIVCRQGESPP